MSEHFLPGKGLDLGEAVFGVLGVHRQDLLSRGGTEDLDDLNKLINAALSWENRLSEHKLSNDATNGPNIDVGSVIRVSENELRRSVVT